MEIGLSVGTNQEDRLAYLREAKARVMALPRTRLLAASSVYDTEPVDVLPENRDRSFLNAVLVLETELTLDALSTQLHRIEEAMGRVRTADRNAPRPIDIDLIYADQLVVASETLTLPHERWSERRFVVAPLAEIRPDLVMAGRHKSVQDILALLPDKPVVMRLDEPW